MSIGKSIAFAAGMSVFAWLAISGPQYYCWSALFVTLVVVID